MVEYLCVPAPYSGKTTRPAPLCRRERTFIMANKQTGADSGSAAKKSGVLNNPVRNLIIAAVVCLVLGVAFLTEPHFIYDYCGYAVGGLVCLIGLVYIIIYFCRKPVSGVYRSEFATGVMVLAVGVYVIVASFRPAALGLSITLRLIVTALGVLIAADGVMKLQYTLDLARMKCGSWWVGLITSALGIALGVLTAIGLVDSFGVMVIRGRDDFVNAMLFLGIGFCVNGVLDLLTMILVAVRNRKAAKAEAAAAAVPAAETPAPATYYTPTPPAAPAEPPAPQP